MDTPSKNRLPQLDALRGLAALSVFWYHAFGMLPEQSKVLSAFLTTPFGAIFNGRSAVWLFFVLSGFVLNRKFVELIEYPRFWKTDFIVRRIFRIYPAFLVTLLLAFVLRRFEFNPLRALAVYPEGFASVWNTHYGLADKLHVMTLIWPGVKVDINPPIWSLVEEMRISLLFPLLIIAVNRWPKLGSNLLCLAIAYVAGFIHPQTATLRHLPHFVLGAICARQMVPISSWLGRQGLWGRAGWFIVSFLLYGITAEITLNIASLSLSNQYVIEQVVGLGSAGLIFFCVACVSPTGFMGSRVMRFIGETSYSFYLSHLILLFSLGYLLFGYTGSYVVTWLMILAVSYAVSFVIFYLVEMPMNRLGHQVVRWAVVQPQVRAFAGAPSLPPTLTGKNLK